MSEAIGAGKPRFAIVNTIDAPCFRHIAEWKPGIGYCYMARVHFPELKRYDGMNPAEPTAIEDFGFDVQLFEYQAVFTKRRDSIATYEDGKPRKWQDSDLHFELPLVGNIRKRRVSDAR